MKRLFPILFVIIMAFASVFCSCKETNIKRDTAKLAAGNEKLNTGDFPGAIAFFDDAIKYNSGDELAYFGRGRAYYNMKDYKKAIADFNKAISINPYEVYILNRAHAKRLLSHYKEAITDYNKVIALNPKIAEAYLSRGYAEIFLDLKDEGMMDFIRAGALGMAEANEEINKRLNK